MTGKKQDNGEDKIYQVAEGEQTEREEDNEDKIMVNRSPEVPRKRLIIGQDSFDLDRDGQLMNEEEEEGGTGAGPSPQPAMELKEEDSGEGASEVGDVVSESGVSRRGLLQHKDSVWSMASSATSVDSSEEDLRDQRRRLQLSLSRQHEGPPTPAESLDSPFLVVTSVDPPHTRSLPVLCPH
ncbi:hypothetical protein E2C01_002434 [Portunus trituberculatus]|uniref:Uncharacterized protein n=1 Tax=Portunus trituberculatus TaxID=210409 RepID=A0A5B7CN84_PORTR|nr:hypothetical protein [Portunus trituberculatus]